MNMFNVSGIKGSEKKSNTDFAPLPKGAYNVSLYDCALKESKSGGEYINMQFRVIDGQFEGRVIFDMITTKNASAKAVEIGMQRLKDFANATGLPDQFDLGDMHGKKLNVYVKIEQSEQYGDKNKVTSYMPYKGETKNVFANDIDNAPF